jgi:hypothetical protein
MGEKTRHQYGLRGQSQNPEKYKSSYDLRKQPKRNYTSLSEELSEEETSFVKRVKKENPHLICRDKLRKVSEEEKPDNTVTNKSINGVIPILETGTVKQEESYEEGYLTIPDIEEDMDGIIPIIDLSATLQEDEASGHDERVSQILDELTDIGIIDLGIIDSTLDPKIVEKELHNNHMFLLRNAINLKDENTILSYLNNHNSLITLEDKLRVLPDLINKNLVRSFSVLFEQLGVEAYNDPKVAEACLNNPRFIPCLIAKTFSVSNSCRDLEIKLFENEKLCMFKITSANAEAAAINLLFAVKNALGPDAMVSKRKVNYVKRELDTDEQSLEIYFSCDFKDIEQALSCLRAIQRPSQICLAEMRRVEAPRLGMEL